MIFGCRASAVCAVAALTSGNAFAHDEQAFRELMERFATIEVSRVAFTEVKSLSILESTLEQSGVLFYSAPATVVREIRQPLAETYTITGDKMHIVKGDSDEQIDLDTAPQLRAFVESFRATLSGDVERLTEHYDVDFVVDASTWHLNLRPRSRRLARFVESVVFTGEDARIDEIDINEANDDWSRMYLTPLEPAGGTE
jgi:outer membrane lipoprotein-sorting protein